MASLSRILGGRKKDSSVWDHFTFNETTGKSRCIVVVETGKKRKSECGTELCGKNTTNLISHLSRFHKEEYDAFVVKEKKKKPMVQKCIALSAPTTKSQTIQDCVHRNVTSWARDSVEHQQRMASVRDMLVDSCYPLTMMDKHSFRKMIKTLDPKFTLPGSSSMKKMLTDEFNVKSAVLLQLLAGARRVTICVDGWSKKSLSSSYVGISACFFDTSTNRPVHAFLNLTEVPHPHTGERLAASLDGCLTRWQISGNKVLLVVTDNGANIVKAVGLLRDKHDQLTADYGHGDIEEDESDEEDLEVQGEDLDVNSETAELELPEQEPLKFSVHGGIQRLPCLAHSLQLLVKLAYKHYDTLLVKTRQLVGRLRRSGAAVEQLVGLCGRTVVSDCTTRWSSTYTMVKRLLEINTNVNKVCTDLGIDSLLTSEWTRLQEVSTLLEPFAVQTDILQTDSVSLSSIIPSLLNLECHLQQSQAPKILTSAMLRDFRHRFQFALQPNTECFVAAPAAACLLDPFLCSVLFTPDLAPVFHAAKMYICSIEERQCSDEAALQPVPCSSAESADTTEASAPAPGSLKRFKFLVTKLKSAETGSGTVSSNLDTVAGQLGRYLADAREMTDEQLGSSALDFWETRKASYSRLFPIAQDLLAAPASQAYVERIFSLCGLLSCGRRNRAQQQLLELRAFLKLNRNIV